MDTIIFLCISLITLEIVLPGIWERWKIYKVSKSKGVLLDWQPTREVWRMALKVNSSSSLLFSVVLGYLLVVFALVTVAGLTLLEGGIFVFEDGLVRLSIRIIGFFFCALLLWLHYRPIQWRSPYHYIFTEEGFWVIGEGRRQSTGYTPWTSLNSVIIQRENLVVLSSGKDSSFDIVYPNDLKQKVETVISNKIPRGWWQLAS